MGREPLSGLDKSILAFSLLIVAVVSYILVNPSWLEHYFVQRRKVFDKLGYVESVSNDTRHKSGSSYLWTSAREDAYLYQYDSLFSGNDSTVEFTLSDQTKVKLSENSLITLDMREGKATLDLSSGEATISLASRQDLDIGFKKRKVKISSASGGKIGMQISDTGNLVLSSPQNKPVNVKINDKTITTNDKSIIVIDSKGKAEVKDKKVKVLSPKMGQDIALAPSQNDIPLTWQAIGDWKNAKLLVSDSRDFSQTLLEENVVTDTHTLDAREFNQGALYWKVIPEGVNADEIHASHFFFTRPEPPQIIFPVELMLETTKKDEQLPVRFQWESHRATKSYVIQISIDREFSKIVSERTIRGTQLQGQKFPAGNYFWRVRRDDSDSVNKEWSRVGRFTIHSTVNELEHLNVAEGPEPKSNPPVQDEKSLDESERKKAIGLLPAPSLVKKEIQEVLQFSQQGRKLASAAPKILNPPQLAWEKIKEATEYQIQISRDKDFTQPIFTTKVASNKFLWKEALVGKNYWRVKALSSDTEGPYSTIGLVQTSLPEPQWTANKKRVTYHFSVPIGNKEKDAYRLSWSPVPMAKKYKLARSTTQTFEGKVSYSKHPTNAIDFSPKKNGVYYFKVATADNEGTPTGDYSEILALDYKKIEELLTPILTSPEDFSTLVSSAENTPFLVFTWESVKGAKTYDIQFSHDKGFKKILEQKVSNEETYMLESVPGGKVYWRVRARGSVAKSPWSPARQFQTEEME